MARDEIKIRVLPRKNEARGADSRGAAPRPAANGISKMIIFAAAGLSLIAVGVGLMIAFRAKPSSHELASQKIIRDPTAIKIDQWVEDAKAKEDFLRRQRLLENMRATAAAGTADSDAADSPNARSYGVTLDSEDTADRLYEELHERPVHSAESTPDARINALLEKNKWLNQQERAERAQYVRNFVKTAFDRGYEVDLDQNLQVVGIRPITNRRISLDQAIDKAIRQGL